MWERAFNVAKRELKEADEGEYQSRRRNNATARTFRKREKDAHEDPVVGHSGVL